MTPQYPPEYRVDRGHYPQALLPDHTAWSRDFVQQRSSVFDSSPFESHQLVVEFHLAEESAVRSYDGHSSAVGEYWSHLRREQSELKPYVMVCGAREAQDHGAFGFCF